MGFVFCLLCPSLTRAPPRTVPGAPIALEGEAVGSNGILLSWTMPPDTSNIEGYVIRSFLALFIVLIWWHHSNPSLCVCGVFKSSKTWVSLKKKEGISHTSSSLMQSLSYKKRFSVSLSGNGSAKKKVQVQWLIYAKHTELNVHIWLLSVSHVTSHTLWVGKPERWASSCRYKEVCPYPDPTFTQVTKYLDVPETLLTDFTSGSTYHIEVGCTTHHSDLSPHHFVAKFTQTQHIKH